MFMQSDDGMLQSLLPGFLTVFTSAGFSFYDAAYARHKAFWLLEARLQVLSMKVLSIPTTKGFVRWKYFRPQVKGWTGSHSFGSDLNHYTGPLHTYDLVVHIRYRPT